MIKDAPEGCEAAAGPKEAVELLDPEGSPLAVDPRELDISLAAHVQQLLFPKVAPVCDWCCTGIRNRMADRVGGDYFDFMTMADGTQGILIGDVTGHGIHASIVMSLIYGFVYRSIRKICSPVELTRQVNDFLIFFAQRSETFDYLFSSTLFFGIIHPQTLSMQYVNAGHIPPMIRRGDEVMLLAPTCQPVGFFATHEAEMGTFAFQPGDRFFLYTDGIIDTVSPSGESYGEDRLRQFVASGDVDYVQFLNDLIDELEKFESDSSPADDSTAMVVDFHGGGLT